MELSDPTFLGQDVFTWRTLADEQDAGVNGGTGGAGAWAWVVHVSVRTSAQTAAEAAAARGYGIGGKAETTTIDGRPAARVVDGAGNALSYFVANAGRVYDIMLTSGSEPRPSQVNDSAFRAIVGSITFMAPVARPTPTPRPAVTQDVLALADAVAAAFAAADANALRDLIAPTCWFNGGYYQSEGTANSRDKFATGLRSAFAQGLKVTVEARPIMTNPPMPGSFWIWSTWSAYGTPPRNSPKTNVQLVFDRSDGRWYWVGALYNAPR
jgi:hypothetical protein